MELYIVSGDYIPFENPIKVSKFEKVNILGRKCLYVELERPVDYSEYGYPALSKFILLDRFSDKRLHELNEFPIEVHMFIPKDESKPFEGFKKFEELFNAAWAEIYDNYELAVAHNS